MLWLPMASLRERVSVRFIGEKKGVGGKSVGMGMYIYLYIAT